jgi:hypothetical protein
LPPLFYRKPEIIYWEYERWGRRAYINFNAIAEGKQKEGVSG